MGVGGENLEVEKFGISALVKFFLVCGQLILEVLAGSNGWYAQY